MAENITSPATDDVSMLRRGADAAARFALLALVLALIALVLSWIALHRANVARAQANTALSRAKDLNTKVENALGSLNKATPGGGVGENNPQPVTGTNPLPNANGQ